MRPTLSISLLFAFTFIITVPLGILIISSLRPVEQIINNTFSPPVTLTIENYIKVFSFIEVRDAFYRSFAVGLFVAFITIGLAITPAYYLARYSFKGKKLIQISIIIIAYIFSPSLLSLPYFQVMSYLGISPVEGILICHTLLALPFAIALMIPIVSSFPIHLEFIALIYGWNTPRRLFYIIIPALWPQITGLAVIIFTVSWKEFIYAYVFNSNGSATLLTTLIMRMYAGEAVNWDLLTPLCVIMLIPAIFAAQIIRTFRISQSIPTV
jgi:multiple sugar transport system permease protein